MKPWFALIAVQFAALLSAGYWIHGLREANRTLREEAREISAKLELARAHTSLLESSMGAAKFDLWLLNSEIRMFRTGENWARVVPKVERQINELNVRFVGIKGLQYDLKVLSDTLGREILDRNLESSSIEPASVAVP